MGAYGQAHTWVIVAFVVLLHVRARDQRFNWHRCVVCGERGEHLIGCPGRRGY